MSWPSCILSLVIASAALGNSLGTDIPEIVRRAKPAVIQIVVLDAQGNVSKTGTGFFVTSDGELVTNFHVVSGATNIFAKANTGAVFFLDRVLFLFPEQDLAVLKFRVTEVPFLKLGDSSAAVEGQHVLIIGNPEGLEGTVSDGIVSAFRNNRSNIQITAPISPGSSGSPVLDESGQVKGIAKLSYVEGQNLNLAIAVETLKKALSGGPPTAVKPLATAGEHQGPTPTPDYAYTKWPDQRLLTHPEHFLKVHVINVQSKDQLVLRSGQGMTFDPVTEIPSAPPTSSPLTKIRH
jgi:hypothetical protein